MANLGYCITCAYNRNDHCRNWRLAPYGLFGEPCHSFPCAFYYSMKQAEKDNKAVWNAFKRAKHLKTKK